MNTYKNISYSAKTFYGVKFNPGDVKSVPGYINSPSMVRINGIKPMSENARPINTISAVPTVTRGRKKKSIDSEKEPIAEVENQIIETISEEETSNGNPS